VVERLGGLPLAMPIIDIYEAVQRGTADGTTIQWTAFQPFKLAEVTSYHVDVFLGSQPSMVLMAKKNYQALPAQARKLIDDNSGEKQTRVFGQFWMPSTTRPGARSKRRPSTPSSTCRPSRPPNGEAWSRR
jgi:TRAP-type C4-dicarboxylate transport system substrate-binding protein